MRLFERIRAVIAEWTGPYTVSLRSDIERVLCEEEALRPWRRIVGYVVLDPEAGRPCFWSRPPNFTETSRAEGVEVFEFVLELPPREPAPRVDATVAASDARRL